MLALLQEWLAHIVSVVVTWALSWHRQADAPSAQAAPDAQRHDCAGGTATPYRPPVFDLRSGARVQQRHNYAVNTPTSAPLEIRVWPDSAASSCSYMHLGGIARLPSTITCDHFRGVRHLRGVHTNVVATLPFLPYLVNLEIKGYNINTVSMRQQLSWQHCTIWTNLRSLRLTAVYLGNDLGLSAVAKLPFWTSLSIVAANISFPMQQVSAVSIASLRSLQIARCSISDNTGAGLCSRLDGMTSLTSLQLSYLVCRPHLQGLHHLSSLSTLQRLDLTGTRVGHCPPDWLQRLTRLSVLTCIHSYVPASLLEAFIYRAQQPQGSRVHMHEPPRARTQDDIDSCQATWVWPH